MATAKERVPAIEGWFTLDPAEPRLIGSRCTICGTYFFPKETTFCRNPACDGTKLEEVPLGRRGTVWSHTVNRYAPPPPYIASDPFEPFGVAAVELAQERMIVLGQVEGDATALEVGDEVELVLGTLYSDDEREYLVWKWKPVSA